MSKITVTTIAGQTSGSDANKVKIESGDTLEALSNATVGGTLGVGGHASIGNSTTIAGTRALTVVGATDGTGSSIITGYNSSLASKFSVRDDGYVNVGNGLNLADGNLSVASGHGIDFSAGANAAGMTSELLDDYEEGTWTATLGGLSSNPTVSAYAYNSGHYTKIGRQVFAHIYMRIENGNISGGSGDATILGLPFTSKSGGSISNGAGAWIENYTYTSTSFSSGRSYARPVMVAGENRMRIYQLSYSNPQQATGWSLGQADDAALMFGGVMVYMTD